MIGAYADRSWGLFPPTVHGKPAVVEYEADRELRDTEQIPLMGEGGIEAFLGREVLPYAPRRVARAVYCEGWIRDQLHVALLQADAHAVFGRDTEGHALVGAGYGGLVSRTHWQRSDRSRAVTKASTDPSQKMTTAYFNHQAAYTAVRIRIDKMDGRQDSFMTGTGFFFLAPLTLGNDKTRSKILLISNKHVIGDGSKTMTLTLNRRKDDGTPELGVLRTFTFDNFADLCTVHPDESIDLACVDVTRITQSDACVKYLDRKFLTPIDYDRVALGSNVLFVGYPNDYYDTINNLPLLRKGTLASMPDIDFRGQGHVVIDAQVFGGSSGSPVFVDWDGKYRAPRRY